MDNTTPYRTKLPSKMHDKKGFSVWSFLERCIGKELSKIAMPVVFNEPLSFLQRLSEYMEYADLINKAVQTTDPVRRFEYVVAFAVSAVASNWDRLGKPFNPVLGETFELNRMEECGYRLIAEQISHHPPVSAFHAEGRDYRFHGTIHPKLTFSLVGGSVTVRPKGFMTLELPSHNEVYSWQNVNCTVHNVIVGKLWVEHSGTMTITNHNSDGKADIVWRPRGIFGKECHRVDGFIYDSSGIAVRALYGKWTECMFSVDPDVWNIHFDKMKNGKSKTSHENGSSKLADTATCKRRSHHVMTFFVTKSRQEYHTTKGAGGGRCDADLSDSLSQTSSGDNIDSSPNIQRQSSEISTASLNGEATAVEEDIPPDFESSCDASLTDQKLLWHVKDRPPDSCDYFNFTYFALSLNEKVFETGLPPTDSRLRQDMHYLEEQQIDSADVEKTRIEEKQRHAAKERKRAKVEWKPQWFQLRQNEYTQKKEWSFNHMYWNRAYENCHDLF